MPMVRALVRAARPRQWVKNLFVGAPLIFAKSLLVESRLLRAGAAVLTFCVISWAVYLWNDIVDVERDRAHPTKRLRPIASGELPIPVARTAAALLAVFGLLAAWLLHPYMAAACGLYLGLNVAYSLSLKHVPYVDVLIIAAGFLIRVNAGAVAIQVHPSSWLLACALLLASFLGFAKRWHELHTHGPAARRVLGRYHPDWLRVVLYASALATVGAYTAYSLAEHTRTYFGTDRMVFTVPCVALGIGRFLQIAARPRDESPTDAMLRDPLFLASIAAWVTLVVVIIYVAR